MIQKFLRQLKNESVIYVRPTDIANQHSLIKSDIDLNGDWDSLGRNIHKGFIYKSFAQRLKGLPWEETLIYQRKKHLGDRWLKKIPIWESMLEDIVNNGYTQKPNADPVDEYISILIGRDGQMFIYNGIHRLVCCLLSKKVDKIPVKVLLRHTQWAQFKRSCVDYAKRRNGLYAQLPHPDLESIPFNHSNERAELIAENSIFPNGKVLDIGSHWGTTSSILASKGFNVTSIEHSKQHFNKLKKVARFPKSKFTPIHKSFLDVNRECDTLVMLNIAHHFIIDNNKRKAFFRWLGKFKCNEIFYQAHKEGDKWSPYMTVYEMLNLIKTYSWKFEVSDLKTFNGRTLYHLT